MKATVLVDNIKSDGIKGEWGLSILCEFNGKKVLLDTGASSLFAKNAATLGISLKDVDCAALSHAHYDHADGMRTFFKENEKAEFYLRDGTAENCFAKKWFISKYIGIPRGILNEYKDRIVFANGIYPICDGVNLIPHTTANLDRIGKRENMYIKENNIFKPDGFVHEQSLVFDTPKGLVVFNSCCHGGADNIINEALEAFPGKNVYALIGGFHIFNKSESVIRNLSKRIKETGIEKVYTGHCTGKRAYRIMRDELGDIVNQLKAGMVIEL